MEYKIPDITRDPKNTSWFRMRNLIHYEDMNTYIASSWVDPILIRYQATVLHTLTCRDKLSIHTNLAPYYLRNLENLTTSLVHSSFTDFNYCFPRLRDLTIQESDHFMSLEGLSRWAPNLEVLRISHCHSFDNFLEIGFWLDTLKSLKDIYISNCRHLTGPELVFCRTKVPDLKKVAFTIDKIFYP